MTNSPSRESSIKFHQSMQLSRLPIAGIAIAILAMMLLLSGCATSRFHSQEKSGSIEDDIRELIKDIAVYQQEIDHMRHTLKPVVDEDFVRVSKADFLPPAKQNKHRKELRDALKMELQLKKIELEAVEAPLRGKETIPAQ